MRATAGRNSELLNYPDNFALYAQEPPVEEFVADQPNSQSQYEAMYFKLGHFN